ncbi:MAG: ABC transporter permease [Microthrixaceae bacterium]|nr:ABC transporter permease [Microthrixaceae bacterium]
MAEDHRTSDVAAIGVMVAGDLRQRIRDRTVFIFALVVPLALMVVFNAVFGGMNPEKLSGVRVTLVSEANDAAAGGLAGALADLDSMEVDLTRLPHSDPNAATPKLKTAVEDDKVDVAITVPADFTRSLGTGGQPRVTVVRRGGIEPQIIALVVEGFVSRAAAAAKAASVAGAEGLAPATIAQVALRVADSPPTLDVADREAPPGQLSTQGALVAGQAAFFMFFTIGFGVVAYLEERELGTLPRLRSLPISPHTVMTAKAVVSFILGVVATAVLLLLGVILFDLRYENLLTVGVVVVVSVAAVTASSLVVVRVARTAEQAQMITAILGVVLGILGGSFFQLTGTGFFARLADLTPTAAFIRGVGVGADGGGIADAAAPLTFLLGFGAISVVAAVLLPDRSPAR